MEAILFGLGLVLIASIIWVAEHPTTSAPKKRVRSKPAANVEPAIPVGLAKRKSGLVKCGMAPKAPKYMRSKRMRIRAHELATSLRLGKRQVATLMEAKRQGVQVPDMELNTIVAGVVLNRKMLKEIEYDQPF